MIVPRPTRSLAIGLAFGGMAALAAPARANGRFPNAQQVRELAPGSLVVAGTYGLLVTTNAGADFQFACELELFGRPADTTTVDPLLELGPGGAILTGSLEGARISRDQACAFEPIASLPRDWEYFGIEPPPDAEHGLVLDLARRGTGSRAPVIALVALIDDSGGLSEHRVYEAPSGDDFRPIGAPIPLSTMDFGSTLDAAPSDPNRIYVSGTLRGNPVVLASSDGAENFTALALEMDDTSDVLSAYIAAVSPSDPERLYVRLPRRVNQENGLYLWDDSLLVSDDGGGSFTERLRVQANFLGFALSPDGETVLAGFGDPSAAGILSDPAAVGIYRADATELVFTKIVDDLDVTCLYWTESGLYACAAERDPLQTDASVTNDFHLGVYRAGGLPASAADFIPLLALRDVRGPPPWFDARKSACADEWQSGDLDSPTPMGACASMNACGPRPALSEGALICGQPSGGNAGEGGADAGGAPGQGGAESGGAPGAGGSDSAGAANAGEDAGGRGGEGAARPGETDDTESDGCACRLGGRPRETWPSGLGALLALAACVLFRARSRQERHALTATERQYYERFLARKASAEECP